MRIVNSDQPICTHEVFCVHDGDFVKHSRTGKVYVVQTHTKPAGLLGDYTKGAIRLMPIGSIEPPLEIQNAQTYSQRQAPDSLNKITWDIEFEPYSIVSSEDPDTSSIKICKDFLELSRDFRETNSFGSKISYDLERIMFMVKSTQTRELAKKKTWLSLCFPDNIVRLEIQHCKSAYKQMEKHFLKGGFVSLKISELDASSPIAYDRSQEIIESILIRRNEVHSISRNAYYQSPAKTALVLTHGKKIVFNGTDAYEYLTRALSK